jgi:hypothetical protein
MQAQRNDKSYIESPPPMPVYRPRTDTVTEMVTIPPTFHALSNHHNI